MLTFFLSLFLQTQLLVNFNPDGVENSLKEHVKYMTADSLMGRSAGTRGDKIVADYIYRELENAGITMLSPNGGDDFFINDTIDGKLTSVHTRNIVGIVEGYDPKLKNEYILIGAHIDNQGINRIIINGEAVNQIFPGADANASGVALLIELAKQIQNQKFLFKRSVIFAFFGAGEESCAGSWYFLNRSFKEESGNIVMMINLNMLGRSGGDNKFQVFTGINNLIINAIIKDLSNRPATISPLFSPTDYLSSDHRMFYQKNIPITLFTTGMHRDYNTPKDTWDKLDYAQMVDIAEFVMAFAQNISERDKNINDVSDNNSVEGRLYSQYEVDKPAEFIHGDERQFLNKWVYKYIKYPDSALKNGIQGRVIVDFVIEKDGSISNILITKGLSDDIDDEVTKVISSSPKWRAAQYGGEKVRVKISLPIDFKLSNSASRNRIRIKK